MTIKGCHYCFDPSKDHILKRGLIDPYDLSDNPEEWVVLDDYIFWSARYQTEIIIPKWMKTDLSSIPKVLRWFISVNERHRLASLPHDFGYALGKESKLGKDAWDNILYDFCKLQGVGAIKRSLMYTAVKIGGHAAFGKGSDWLIPLTHREFYIKNFPKLNLNLSNDTYKVV